MFRILSIATLVIILLGMFIGASLALADDAIAPSDPIPGPVEEIDEYLFDARPSLIPEPTLNPEDEIDADRSAPVAC